MISDEPVIKLFSDEVNYEEHMGMGHWMLYSDGQSIFAKNYVKNTKVSEILSDLEDVKALAVDANRGYLFVAT